ncbi:hypothetical protein [Halobellus rufus]|uniref:hypothetical protein n=1 Tax=Halobellus rufus TaxID=1448860 RepID=UPI000679D907|nr:hypothetical protein [Halobellus rufus]
MGFDSEQEMREVAIDSINQDFAQDESILLEEFTYGNGRADIVLANPSTAYLDHRINELKISSALDSKSQLQVFLQLHSRGPITRDYFYTVGAMGKRKKQNALEELLKKGFVEELDNGKIQTAHDLRRHVTTSYSIELKLSKWKKALEQAVRGKSFSEYQYVALDGDNVLRAMDNLELFEEYGVGLMEISEEGDICVYKEPSRQKPYSPMNKWRLNERTILEQTPQSIYSD